MEDVRTEVADSMGSVMLACVREMVPRRAVRRVVARILGRSDMAARGWVRLGIEGEDRAG